MPDIKSPSEPCNFWHKRSVLALLTIAGILLVWILSGMAFLPYGAPLLRSSVWGLDHTYILTDARMLINHTYLLFSHEIGFPLGADRYYFPHPTYIQLFTLFVGTLLTHDVFASVEFYYFVTAALVFVSCFYSLRWLEVAPLPAFIVSIAYCLIPFARDRFATHDDLSAYYAAPLVGALAMNIGRIQPSSSLKQTVLNNIRTPFVIIAFVVTAWSSTYFVFFGAFFIGLAGVFITLGNRKPEPLVVAVAQVAVICLLFAIGLLPYLVQSETFPVRGPSDQYLAAIRVPDFLHEFHSHRWQNLYNDYVHKTRPFGEGFDFWPGRFLSWIVLFSPAVAFIAAQQRSKIWFQGAAWQTVILASTLITAAILFGLPESYGYLFNMLVTGTIRGQDRASIFVAFFALVILLAFWPQLEVRLKKYRYVPPLALMAFMLFNAYPVLGYAWLINRATEKTDLDNLTEIHTVLDKLHGAGAHAVLQLPIAGWPEIPDIGAFSPYRHLWFYILDSTQPSLRWSYGMDWHQPEFLSLKGLGNALETASSKEAWQRFRCLGFDAVIIEKAAYTPAVFAQLSESLRRDFGIDRPMFISDHRAVYMLTPIPDGPAMCPSKPGTEAYKIEMSCPVVADFTSQGGGTEEMISGFYDSEPFGRWNAGNNSSFFCKFLPAQHPSKIKIVTRAFAPQGHNQRMRVTINRGQPQDFLYENGAEDKTIDMKIPPTTEGHFSIRFEFPDAVKPRDFGVSGESRKIAVSIRSITFE